MFQNDAEIDCYHDLILAEYSNLEANAFSFENPNSRLDRFQVTSICSNRGVKQADIQKEGLLIQYPDGTLRTMHLDLIYRAVNARAASWSTKISLEFKLVKPREESIPSFTEHKLDQLASVLNVDSGIARIIVDSLHEAGYQGLAHHQLHYLSKIITRQDKGYLLVAPTASGKSLIFYITALASILSEKSTKGTKALILYPRKALASDQLMKFLRVVCALNRRLSLAKLPRITVGIDDGDTPRSSSTDQARKGEVFRGIKCVENQCEGKLHYLVTGSSCHVVCEKCGRRYEEIIPTKVDIWSSSPDIVFSNLSALNRRLMTKAAQGMIGSSVKWIVLDEAHVYREELGGHARWLLRRILARFQVLLKGDARFIVSSATIHNPIGFLKKLLGVSQSIYYEEYSKILEASKEKKRKLIINLIIAPNPLRSAESLAEELALLLGVWGFANAKKSIVFVDNVSEVERLRDFVVQTIIQEREAHNDHLDPKKTPIIADISNSFSWVGVSRGLNAIHTGKLVELFDHHYADLPPDERARVEDSFKNRSAGILFATSTMELGMDIGSIAAIIQYKIPLTAESYVQRIGRAGRSDEVGRIALGILVLTNSPSQIRYVLEDEYKRMLEPQVEIPIAWENEEIKKQHVVFSLLDYEAAKNRNTFMDFVTEVKPLWFSVADTLNSLKALTADVRRELPAVAEYQNEIAGDDSSVKILADVLDQIDKRIDYGLKNYRDFAETDISQGLLKLRKSQDRILEARGVARDVLRSVKEIKKTITAKELDEYESSANKLEESLGKVLTDIEKLWS